MIFLEWNRCKESSIKLIVENQFAFALKLSSVLGPIVLLPKFLDRHVLLGIFLHDLKSRYTNSKDLVWKWIAKRVMNLWTVTEFSYFQMCFEFDRGNQY